MSSKYFLQTLTLPKFNVINPPSIHFIFTNNKEQESLVHNKWPNESNKVGVYLHFLKVLSNAFAKKNIKNANKTG